MITSVAIRNLRGIREGQVEGLTPLTVLVGPNGCGKSTVLDALLIAASPRPWDAVGRAVVRRQTASSPPAPDDQGVVRPVLLNRDELNAPHWLVWNAGFDGPAVVAAQRDDRPEPSHHTIEARRTARDPRLDCTFGPLPAEAYRTTVEFASAQVFGFHGVTPQAPDWPEIVLVGDLPEAFQTPLYDLYRSAVTAGTRDRAVAALQAVMPDLERVEILTEADLPVLCLTHTNRSVPVQLTSDGTRALVRMAFEVFATKAGLVLLEEPEAHQHPRFIGQVAEIIWAAVRRGVQVVLSTHSLELLDALLTADGDLAALSVHHLHLPGERLVVNRTAGDDAAFAREQIAEDLR